jgi:hypothetical protein
MRNRLIGVATPEAVRWALARRYPWLEFAYAMAYTQIGIPQFDARSGALLDWQANLLVQQFLNAIRVPGGLPITSPDTGRAPDTVEVDEGVLEYSKWVDGARNTDSSRSKSRRCFEPAV